MIDRITTEDHQSTITKIEIVEMIYDCFIFFGGGAELDLLEIRFAELEDVVDKFVIVEATSTFSGQPHEPVLDGPVRFQRFMKWCPRVRYVLVDDMPIQCDSWGREYFQRNCILRGLTSADPMDLILISDADEIPKASSVYYANQRVVREICPFLQRLSYYHVNQRAFYDSPISGLSDEIWTGTKAVRFCEMTTPQKVRDLSCADCSMHLDDAGWHFTYLGGAPGIQEKITSYSHQELNRPEILDQKHIEQCAAEGKDLFGRNYTYKTVPLDDTFPKYLVDNRDKFAHLIA